MNTTAQKPAPQLGDVVADSYGNPAVIVRIEMRDTPHVRWSIMQTCGSDRGNVTSCPVDRVTRLPYPALVDAEGAERVRAVVRAEARRRGWRWNADGITR